MAGGVKVRARRSTHHSPLTTHHSSTYVVLVTCPRGRHADTLATSVVRERLAACVNILPSVQSRFWWNGKVDRANESLLIMKTSARRFSALMRVVRAHHPYEVPEIIALPIVRSFQPYLAWVLASLSIKNSASRS